MSTPGPSDPPEQLPASPANPPASAENLPVASDGRSSVPEPSGHSQTHWGIPPQREWSHLPELSEAHLRRPRRRVMLPIVLFVATCLSTFWVGAANWRPQV